MFTRRVRPPFQYSPVEVRLPEKPSADQSLLMADIRFMERRIVQRELWSAASVRELLQGAAEAGVSGSDVVSARKAFEKAEKIFQDDVLTKNRLFYLLGPLCIAAAVAVAWIVGGVLARAGVWDLSSARSEFLLALTFAVVGSCASILMRLSTIDLKDELRKKWVTVSAIMPPLLAVAFASVIYLIIKGGLVKFQGFEVGDPKKAMIWVASFLCGFSERFAVDILDRLPLSKPQAKAGDG
jgi:hypothetical protein